jgi:hypothetical protein
MAAGCTPQPHAAWMAQQARNFAMIVKIGKYRVGI